MPQHERVKEPNKSSDPFDHHPAAEQAARQKTADQRETSDLFGTGEANTSAKKQGVRGKIAEKLTSIVDRQESASSGNAEPAPDRAQKRTTYEWAPHHLKPIVNSPNPSHIGLNSESGQGKIAADLYRDMAQSHEYNLKIPWWKKHTETVVPEEGEREPLVPGPEPQPAPKPEPKPEPKPKPGPAPKPKPNTDDTEMKALGPGPVYQQIGPVPRLPEYIGPAPFNPHPDMAPLGQGGPGVALPLPGQPKEAITSRPQFEAIEGPKHEGPATPLPGPRNKEITSRPQFEAIEGPKQGPMRPQSSRPTPRELTAAGREEASDRVMPFKVTTLGERQNEQTTGHQFPWLSASAPHQMRDRPGGETMSIPTVRSTGEHPAAVVHGAQGGPMLSRGQRTGGAARIANIFRPGGTFRPGGGTLLPKRGKASESSQQVSAPPTATSAHGNLYSVPVDMHNLHRGPGDKGPKVDMTNLFREPNA